MRTLIITIAIVLIAVTAQAGSNWRNHVKVCNGNKVCMKEQAKAQDLWTGQVWDEDLKRTCDHHLQMYNKDYIAAVNCVYPLQVSRQDYIARQTQNERDRAETQRARAEARYYRRGGRVFVATP